MLQRFLTIVIISIVLGTLTTIGVAWCSAIWVSPFKTPARAATQNLGAAGKPVGAATNYARWGLNIFRMDTAEIYESLWLDPGGPVGFDALALLSAPPGSALASNIPDWASHLVPPDPPIAHMEEHVRSIDSRGWPMLAMWSARDRDTHKTQWLPVQHRWAIPIWPGKRSNGNSYDRVLPLGVHWPAFLGNTGIYSAVYFLPLIVYRWIRYGKRWRRRQNNQCIMCGYPIGASALCTECGADLSKQRHTLSVPASEP